MTTVRRWTWFGRIFMACWVLFALPSIYHGLSRGLSAESVAGSFAFTGWSVTWAWFWLRALGRSRAKELIGFISITVLLSLFALLGPTPVGVGGLLVFSFVLAGATFPLRQAVLVIVGLAALQIALSLVQFVDVTTTVGGLVNSVLVGLVGVGGRQLWMSYRELVAAREEIARLAVSEERLRFARDLHDILGQSLTMIVLKSEVLARQLPPDADESTRQELRDVARIARKSLKDVREAVTGYRRPDLAGEISAARAALRDAGIGFLVEDQLGPVAVEQDIVLAWCVREAVTNVLKHSGARKCELRLSHEGDVAHLELGDDGLGAKSFEGGSGLLGLRERVGMAGGTFDVGPGAHGGVRVQVSLPTSLRVKTELAAS